MDISLPISAPNASRRELTVYDSPPERTPEEEARERAKEVETHPFLHYLAQFVEGLRPAAAQGAEPAPAVQAVDLLPRFGLEIWNRQLTALLADAPAPLVAAEAPAPETVPIVVAPPPQAAAPPQQAIEPEAAPPVAPVEMPRIIVGQIDRLRQNGVPATTLTVRLDPPHLGKVDLAFTYSQQRVSVNVVAATQQAKDQLELQLAQIRGILHAHQLPTGELKVMLAGDAGAAGGHGQQAEQDGSQQPQRYRRRRRSASFEEELARVW
ncbi:MAG: flagellar hook-length control protein FliK [Candidatus Sericytochromatia bacterium]|nr:flagellar hook-length control protein FliK [Candidatus Tanganyikabacteria bacterium]